MSLRVVLVRFLRKLLLTLRLRSLTMCIRGVPLQLDLLLATLFRPLAHTITDPFSGTVVEETGASRSYFNFSSILFRRSKPFGTQKQKKRGRVKRKIRRKIIQSGSVVDAL